MQLSIPGLCFVTTTVPLKFDTDGHATCLDPPPRLPADPENVLVLTDVHVERFGLTSTNGVSIFERVVLADDSTVPEIFDGTQQLAGKRILILMLNGWGDMILIQPALRGFFERAVVPDDPPHITIGCNWMDNFPYPDAPFIHEVRPNIMTLKDLGRFDLLVNMIPVNHRRTPHKSMKDLYMEVMGLNGNAAANLRPSIAVDPKKTAGIAPFLGKIRSQKGKKLLCVNWKSRFPHKNAPPALIFEVVEKLSGAYQAVMFKDAEQAAIMQQEIDAAGCPIENLSGRIRDYHDTVAALSMVDAVVSVDTGIVHAAGALGIPGVALFGPFPPETHVADYPSVTGLSANYQGSTCQGPCLETHRGCAEVNFAPEKISPCFQAIASGTIVAALEQAVAAAGAAQT